MTLSEYFDKAKGIGVLATADGQGKVNVALYARPHFLDENDPSTCAFIMSDRQSHANLQSNPHAAYLFMEEGAGYVGRRLTLSKLREETDQEKIQAIRRRTAWPASQDEVKYLVYFHIDAVRPLVGTEEGGS